MIDPAFVYDPPKTRAVFGAGTIARVGLEMSEIGVRRALVIATPGRAEHLAPLLDVLGARTAAVFTGARMHVPVALVGEVAAIAGREEVDCCVTFGGGSTIGLAKALARQRALPILAIPTTYSGSEMTPIWGITDERHGKQTGRDPAVQPRVAIYDPLVSLDLPPAIGAASGMNALAHAVAGLYAPDRTSVSDWMATEAIRTLAEALPRVVADGRDVAARSRAFEGAWLAGMVLATTTMGVHHRMCHLLGGWFGLPHAETHAVLLPYTTAFAASRAPEPTALLAGALGAPDAVAGLVALQRALPLPRSLAALGLPSEHAREAARAFPERDELVALLEAAFEGAPPPR